MAKRRRYLQASNGTSEVKKSTSAVKEPLLPTMFVRVIKSASPATAAPVSQQLAGDDFDEYYEGEIVVQPYLSPEGLLKLAEENPVHAACITAVAADATGRGWKLENTGRPDLSIERMDIKDAQQELLQKLDDITPTLTFSELLRQAVWELRAIGWSAWEIARNPSGEVGAIYPLPAHTIRVLKNGNGFLQMRNGKMRYFRKFGQEGQLPQGVEFSDKDTGNAKKANEVLYFQAYHPRTPVYGLPDWIAATTSMAEMSQIREYNMSWFASGGMADRIITVTADSDKVADAIAANIEKQIKAAKGLGHVSIVVSGSKDVEIKIDSTSRAEGQRDGQFRNRRDDLVKEVLMAHSVPPYRIGFAELGPVHKETEVLTPEGWKPVKDVRIGEIVGSYDTKKKSIVWEAVEGKVKRKYKTLLRMGNGSKTRKNPFAFEVSVDHRMWVAHQQKALNSRKSIPGAYHWMTAGEMSEKTYDYFIPTAAPLVPSLNGPSVSGDEAELIGWLVSEGSIRYRRSSGYEVCLYQKEGEKAERIRKVLKRLKIKFSDTEMSSKSHVLNGRKISASSIRCFRLLGEGKHRAWDLMGGKKAVPYTLLNASVSVKRRFLEAALLGDGCWIRNDVSAIYYTKDETVADGIQAIAETCGVNAWKVARKGQYEVRIKGVRGKQDRRCIKKISEVPYNDYAYCLTVPAGALLYRFHGHCYIAGNTLGGSAAREMLRAYRFGAIEPVQTIIEDRLTTTLFGPQGLQIPSSMRWVLQDVDFELVDLNLLIATRGVQNGFATPSQGGQLMGFDPVEDINANRLYMDGVAITGDVRENTAGTLFNPEAGSGLPTGLNPINPTPMEVPQKPMGGNGRGGSVAAT